VRFPEKKKLKKPGLKVNKPRGGCGGNAPNSLTTLELRKRKNKEVKDPNRLWTLSENSDQIR